MDEHQTMSLEYATTQDALKKKKTELDDLVYCTSAMHTRVAVRTSSHHTFANRPKLTVAALRCCEYCILQLNRWIQEKQVS